MRKKRRHFCKLRSADRCLVARLLINTAHIASF